MLSCPYILYAKCDMLCFVGTVVWSGLFVKTKPHPPTIFQSFTGCSVYYIIDLAKYVHEQGRATMYERSYVAVVIKQRSIDQ